jgi:Domain of unknown function (DUF6894)
MPRFYFHFRDAKVIEDDSGEELSDTAAANEHARRMAMELSDEPHKSDAAIIVSDGRQELFEVPLPERVTHTHARQWS